MVLSTFDQENHDRILKEHSEKIGFNHGKKQESLKVSSPSQKEA